MAPTKQNIIADLAKCQLSNLYPNSFFAYFHDTSLHQNCLSRFLNMLSLKFGVFSKASMHALKNAAININMYDTINVITNAC